MGFESVVISLTFLLFKEPSSCSPFWLLTIYIPSFCIKELAFLQTLSTIVCRLFEKGPSDRFEKIPRCSFGRHFFNRDPEPLFTYSLAIWMPSLRSVHLDHWPVFLLGCLDFWCWATWAVCICWRWIPCGYPHLETFTFPNLKMDFFCHLGFPLLCKPLRSMRSLLFTSILFSLLSKVDPTITAVIYVKVSSACIFLKRERVITSPRRSSINLEFLFLWG